jgi:hypothetical protein
LPKPQIPQLTLVERRRAPRFVVDFPCEVITLEGDSARGRIKDLSLTGLQMQGNTSFVRTLHPNFKRTDWRTPLKITVKFSLPTSQRVTADIQLSCQLVYCKRSTASSYKVGCHYLEIQPQVQTAMEDHIRHFGVAKDT